MIRKYFSENIISLSILLFLEYCIYGNIFSMIPTLIAEYYFFGKSYVIENINYVAILMIMDYYFFGVTFR